MSDDNTSMAILQALGAYMAAEVGNPRNVDLNAPILLPVVEVANKASLVTALALLAQNYADLVVTVFGPEEARERFENVAIQAELAALEPDFGK